VLFCNKPVAAKAPALRDLAPTILKEFGLAPAPEMTGRHILG
jgi:bisphosphoglycerate-independent phosphoglycerate mutase (AlkP superfamily)